MASNEPELPEGAGSETWSLHQETNLTISSLGRVRGARGKLRKLMNDRCGYLVVTAIRNGKHSKIKVHRLVAEAFGLHMPERTIDHVDGDKRNNALSNLRCLSFVENTKAFWESGRPNRKCKPVTLNGIVYRSMRAAQAATGVSRKIMGVT